MGRRCRAAELALLLGALAGSVRASSYFYGASAYNVFVRNNFSDFNSDIQGGVAAGGTVSTTGGISFASLGALLGYSVVAAGDFVASGSGSLQGNLYDGTAGGISSNFTVTGSVTSGGSSPVDFADAFSQLGALSASLGGMAATAGDSCVNYYGSINCTVGSSAALHVIRIGAATSASSNGGTANSYDFGNNYGINITAANPDVTLVIDVAGGSGTLTSGAGWNLNGISGTRVLVNYYQATALTLGTSGVEASLLAPLADVTKAASGGYFDGNFIANSFSTPGGGETFRDQLFTGALPSQGVPEPVDVALLGGGLAVLAYRLRVRRAATGAGVIPRQVPSDCADERIDTL